MLIKDLIEVPPVRTVVRIEDLSNQTLRRSMVESFILTGETSFALENILEKIARLEGHGFFLLGNYGSGKSHLLNVFSLILSEKEAGKALLADSQATGSGLPPLLRSAQQVQPLAVEISLVEHSNREYLEQIVFSHLQHKLQQADPPSGKHLHAPPQWKDMTRREAFQALRELLREGKWGGLVLLIDELSEFLRSKEDFRSYNEDVRFLQYLGEFAEAIPLWVVAALQENIESTGSLSGELLHKIKDRYPVRFKLTGEHVKEIISRRLIRKREAAGEQLPEIYEELLQSFGELPFSLQSFYDLYPVHPQTVELLDELRPFFSQHRGIVDFIHYRLTGDKSRGIPPFLENPPDRLLTPDLIFDHFRDRIRETVETNPYSDRVFHYYEREMEDLFPDEEDTATALRIIKLLIIGTLAPAPRHFSAGEVTQLLLHRYTELESRVNYDYVAEILEKLVAQGAFVAAEESEHDGWKRYYINLEADTGPLIKKKLEQLTKDLVPGDFRPIHRLLSWLDENYLPLHRLQQEPLQDIEVTWQNTKRLGKLYFCSPGDLSAERVEDFKREVKEEETDFIFLITPPSFSSSSEKEKETEEKNFFQLLKGEKDESFLSSLILWMPRRISGEEEKQLQQAYAYQMLYQEYDSDSSTTGRQIREQLKSVLEDEKRKTQQIFRNIYFQGQLEAGEKSITPETLGYLHFNDLLSQCASEALKARFPRHFEISPQGEPVTSSLMQRTLDMLSSPHIAEEALERGPRFTIENYLKPLGLVKKRGQGYVLEISPKASPLVAEFFSLVGQERVPLQKIYWKLRKGHFGLSQEGFRALGLSAALSGAVSAYQGGRRLPLSKINYYRFWKIEEIGPGTLIRPELQGVLREVPFLPPRLKDAPLTFAAQQAIWDQVISFKEEWEEKIRQIKLQLKRLEGYRLFAGVNWEKAEKILERFEDFLQEIKVSYSSQEGLERFLAAFQSRPFLAEDYARLEALHQFFAEDLNEILRLGHYLKDPQLQIPTGEEKYSSLLQRFRLLQEFLEDEALFFNREYREKLKKEFKHFQEDYITSYLQEHEKVAGPESLKAYRTLMESDSFRLLELLGKIHTLVVEDDIAQINRQLRPILERECRAVEEPLLRERPACTCGFKLGEKNTLPMAADLEAQMLTGIRSYLLLLQKEENKTKIESYAEHLEMVGKRREAAPLRHILKISPRETDPTKELLPHLNNKTVEHINRALTGDAIIAERSLEDLHAKLSNRVFSPEQLKEIFFSWVMGEEGKAPDYIRIADPQEEKKTAPGTRDDKSDSPKEKPSGELLSHEVKGFLKNLDPDLLPLYRQAGEELLKAALLLGWLKYHGLPLEQAEPFLPGLLHSHHFIKESPSTGEKLAHLGEIMIKGEGEAPQEHTEQWAKEIEEKLGGQQLLELRSSQQTAKEYSFDRLLEKFYSEPLFLSLLQELGRKLAAQLVAEEIEVNIKVMKGALEEARRASSRNYPSSLLREEEVREIKEKYLESLISLSRCSLSLRFLEKALHKPPENDKHWEDLYRQVAHFEKELSFLEESPEKEIIPDYSLNRWKHYFFSSLEALDEKFSTYYQSTAKKNTLSKLLTDYQAWVRQRKDRQGAYLLILDGARLDIWEELLLAMQQEHGLQLVKEGFSWAHQPSVTEAQLEPLQEEGLLGNILKADEGNAASLFEPHSLKTYENLRAIINAAHKQPQALQVIKLNFIDDKIHTSRDSLATLLQEILLASRKKLWPLLENLPSKALLLIAADHGFKTNPHYESFRKIETPRYLHGDTSLLEILAPWALLEKK